jgi:hypothetical protein
MPLTPVAWGFARSLTGTSLRRSVGMEVRADQIPKLTVRGKELASLGGVVFLSIEMPVRSTRRVASSLHSPTPVRVAVDKGVRAYPSSTTALDNVAHRAFYLHDTAIIYDSTRNRVIDKGLTTGLNAQIATSRSVEVQSPSRCNNDVLGSCPI